jgi:NAD+ synthase (glutamine-hydrolysing)
VRFGVGICEDIWREDGPALSQAASGAHFLININASPYSEGKHEERLALLSKRAAECRVPIIYLNMSGGQDELVFDGRSLVVDCNGRLLAEGKRFAEDTITLDISPAESPALHVLPVLPSDVMTEEILIPDRTGSSPRPAVAAVSVSETSGTGSDGPEDIYMALVLGVSDYARKNGFSRVCLGLSGGIDSALVAAIATDALGRENISTVFMPSHFTSEESRTDAYELAGNLGVRMLEVPITPVFESYLETLAPAFADTPSGIAEENIQARIRGNILMALSNKFGWLVLTTGNKSEMSVGYATLYGDMAGGFAPIKDVPKTLVYALCEWRNKRDRAPVIPMRIMTREPTAELRQGQKDSDSLPPYPVLDPILKAYVEDMKGFDEIVAMGFDPDCVKKVINLVDHSEYKRRQSPPGTKITYLAFGRDRRFPITNRYRSC